MNYTPERIAELLNSISWKPSSALRVFWIRYSEGARVDLAERIIQPNTNEAIVPLVVRGNGFSNANAVLSDVQQMFEINRSLLERFRKQTVQKVTVLLIGKNDFSLPQISSPIVLPDWFPVLPSRETYFHIADLGMSAEVALLDCAEARIEEISQFVYDLEFAIVDQLKCLSTANPERLQAFVDTVHGGATVPNSIACLQGYSEHLDSVIDPRAYRPNAAQDSKFLISRLLKLALNKSPKDIAASAKAISNCFNDGGYPKLKPTFFAAMLRPAAMMDGNTANWHSIIFAFYQAYQLMNGAAHAGEYPQYAVTLQYANSVDLRTFLVEARAYVEVLNPA